MPDLSPRSLSLAVAASHDLVVRDGVSLPVHLYGTRAALFHLLREAAVPFAPLPEMPQSHGSQSHGLQSHGLQSGAVLRMGSSVSGADLVRSRSPADAVQGQMTDRASSPRQDARPATPNALQDMLLSDSFDFRSPGDQV
jgi:hypothetical protein